MNDIEWFSWLRIFDVVEYRGQVGKLWGITFIIHTKENGHNLPHLHAKYQNCEIVLEIPSGKVLQGNLPPSKEKKACEWVKDNEHLLVENWNALTEHGLELNDQFRVAQID